MSAEQNRNQHFQNWFLGPQETYIAEGYDALYSVEQDYQIPSPSARVQEQLVAMNNRDDRDKGGIKDAMNSVFGGRLFGKEKPSPEAAFGMPATASQPTAQDFEEALPRPQTAIPSPLQVVQNGASAVNIVVLEPRSFEDSLEVVSHLKQRKTVILNLQHLDTDVSQRVLDFVSGATLAMDGSQERVGTGVFIFASINCKVEAESEGTKAYKDLFQKTFGI